MVAFSERQRFSCLHLKVVAWLAISFGIDSFLINET